jgi:hypothetical protein
MTVTDRRQTRPLVREGSPQRQHGKFQTENNIWSQVPEWTWHQGILINWPSVVTWLWLWLAALPMVTLKISPCTNVTLTLGWITLFMRDMGEAALHREDEVTVKQGDTKMNWPINRRSQCNLKLNLRHCTANYRPVLSSERAPYMKTKKEAIVTQINVTSSHLLQKGQDTKTNWPTDRRS